MTIGLFGNAQAYSVASAQRPIDHSTWQVACRYSKTKSAATHVQPRHTTRAAKCRFAAHAPLAHGFPEDVEARFAADTGVQRSRSFQMTGLVALAIYDLFLFNDWFARPEVMAIALAWRLGVVSVYGLLVLALIRRGLPPHWPETALASTSVVALLGSCMIFSSTKSGPGIYDPFVFSLIFLAGTVFQFRFVSALISSVVALLVAAVFVFGPNALPQSAKPFAMVLLVATAFFTVLACFRLERAERRTYLLIVREVTRSKAAVQVAGTYAALAQTDALTQLANRRAFDSELPQRWNEAIKLNTSVAVLLIDIDNFKRFNDRFGHPAGDECLRRVAQLMREVLRDQDFIARIGGEEFAVLPQPGSKFPVAHLAERLRSQIEQAGIPHDGQGGQHVVTISLGFAASAPAKPFLPAALIAAADSALYEAKRQGRNRCVESVGKLAGTV